MKNKFANLSGEINDNIGVDINALDDPGYVHQLGVKAQQSTLQTKAMQAGLKHLKTIASNEAIQAQLYQEANKAGLKAVQTINKAASKTTITDANHVSQTELLKQSTANRLGEIKTQYGYTSSELTEEHRLKLRLLATKHQAKRKELVSAYNVQTQSLSASRDSALQATQFNNYLDGKSKKNPYQTGFLSGVGNFIRGIFR